MYVRPAFEMASVDLLMVPTANQAVEGLAQGLLSRRDLPCQLAGTFGCATWRLAGRLSRPQVVAVAVI
jgi:hypothetical protein